MKRKEPSPTACCRRTLTLAAPAAGRTCAFLRCSAMLSPPSTICTPFFFFLGSGCTRGRGDGTGWEDELGAGCTREAGRRAAHGLRWARGAARGAARGTARARHGRGAGTPRRACPLRACPHTPPPPAGPPPLTRPSTISASLGTFPLSFLRPSPTANRSSPLLSRLIA